MPEVPDTVDDALDGLSSPSTDDVEDATRSFSSREIGSSAASRAMGAGGGGGSQPGAITVHDLGVVTAVELLAGAKVLVSPAAGDFVALTLSRDDFVPLSATGYTRLDAGPTDSYLGAPIIDWAPAIQMNPDSSHQNAFGSSGTFDQFALTKDERNLGAISDGSDVVAALHLFWSDIALIAATQAWSSTHAFASGVIVNAAGGLFSSGGGTSGGSEPDFASIAGDTPTGQTLSDGTITWTLEGDAPAAGAIHLYALRATPV